MKCPNCDGKGYAYVGTAPNPITRYGYKRICDKCHGTGEIEQTNDEWRKTCSTEEFAEFLFEKACYCSMCGDESQDTEEKIKSCPFGKTACVKKDWEWWLKEIHNDGKKIVP